MAYDRHEAELSWLGRQLTSGRISRRDFMGRAAALGVTTALAGTLCAQAVQAAAPKKRVDFPFGLTPARPPTRWIRRPSRTAT